MGIKPWIDSLRDVPISAYCVGKSRIRGADQKEVTQAVEVNILPEKKAVVW